MKFYEYETNLRYENKLSFYKFMFHIILNVKTFLIFLSHVKFWQVKANIYLFDAIYLQIISNNQTSSFLWKD